jgi:hypothetical protein
MKRLALLVAPLLASCGDNVDTITSKPTPVHSVSSWQVGPIIDGKNYSEGVSISGTSFHLPAPPLSVHYVTRAVEGLAGNGLTIRYRIDGEGPVVGANCPASNPSQLFLYFQRDGDDWQAKGKTEAYRWWASFAPGDLTSGEHEISAPFSAKWTAVETSDALTNPDAFRDALAHAKRVGFTFSNCTGLGHGAWAMGPARFTLLDFRIE